MPEPKSDLQRAFDALTNKQALYTLLWAYYDGAAPLRYVTDRLKDVFQNREARFTQNWAAVVVDSELERIRLKEFNIATPTVEMPTPEGVATTVTENPIQAQLNDLFQETELNLDADDVHTATLVCGEAFVFVWKEQNGAVEAYYNDPRLCHVFYDDENPRLKSFAVKWWVGTDDAGEERRYLNLYYEDRIEYYVSGGKPDDLTDAKGLNLLDTAPNPFMAIPIFHFRKERRAVKSALANVVEPQDAVNKLFADMMVSAEFGAFRQRWIITNSNTDALKNSPNEIWTIPAGDGEGQQSSVGDFEPTDLQNYLKAMTDIANNIAIITRTPKHYFFGQGGTPSGEALIAMESPLNKKAQTTIDRLKPTWAQVAAFMLKLEGVETPSSMIVPLFEEPETVQPLTRSIIRQNDVNAGIPLVTSLRREGWTEEELAQLEEDKAKQAAEVDGAALRERDIEAVRDTLSGLGIGDLLPDEDEG